MCGVTKLVSDLTKLGGEISDMYIYIYLLFQIKITGLTISILNLFVSLVVFILFDYSSNQFQFVQEYHQVNSFDFYLGLDGLSIYFVLLTTIIIPISLLSN
jgi:NADH:ubiquinone oxidoreductase subunit 4 (subunit M)